MHFQQSLVEIRQSQLTQKGHLCFVELAFVLCSPLGQVLHIPYVKVSPWLQAIDTNTPGRKRSFPWVRSTTQVQRNTDTSGGVQPFRSSIRVFQSNCCYTMWFKNLLSRLGRIIKTVLAHWTCAKWWALLTSSGNKSSSWSCSCAVACCGHLLALWYCLWRFSPILSFFDISVQPSITCQ